MDEFGSIEQLLHLVGQRMKNKYHNREHQTGGKGTSSGVSCNNNARYNTNDSGTGSTDVVSSLSTTNMNRILEDDNDNYHDHKSHTSNDDNDDNSIYGSDCNASVNIDEVLVKLQQEDIREVWQLPFVDSFQWDKMNVPIGWVAAIRCELTTNDGDSSNWNGRDENSSSSGNSSSKRSKRSHSHNEKRRHRRRRPHRNPDRSNNKGKRNHSSDTANKRSEINSDSRGHHHTDIYGSENDADCDESSVGSSPFFAPALNEHRWSPQTKKRFNKLPPLSSPSTGLDTTDGNRGRQCSRRDDTIKKSQHRSKSTDFRSPISVLEIPIECVPMTPTSTPRNLPSVVHGKTNVGQGAPTPLRYPGLEQQEHQDSPSPQLRCLSISQDMDGGAFQRYFDKSFLDSPPIPPRRQRSVREMLSVSSGHSSPWVLAADEDNADGAALSTATDDDGEDSIVENDRDSQSL